MFLNICSLTKTRNGIKANLALEAGLFTNDIDICVVSETHLKRIVPDSVVAISNYTVPTHAHWERYYLTTGYRLFSQHPVEDRRTIWALG